MWPWCAAWLSAGVAWFMGLDIGEGIGRIGGNCVATIGQDGCAGSSASVVCATIERIWFGILCLATLSAVWFFGFTFIGRRLIRAERVAPLALHGLWVLVLLGLLGMTVLMGQPRCYLLMPLVAMTAMALSGSAPLEHWGFTAGDPGRRYLGWVALVGLAIILPQSFVTEAWVRWMQGLGAEPTVQPLVAAFPEVTWKVRLLWGIEIVAVAPLVEETAFTGFLYPWLKGRVGRACAMAINALIFSLAHLHPTGIPHFILTSIINVWAFETTGRLGASILLHAAGNLLVWTSLCWAFASAGPT